MNFIKKAFEDHSVLFCVILSFVINFTIEATARLSFVGGILYISKHPFYFLYNTFLLFFTYVIAMFFKRRTFSVSLVSVWWIIASIVNAVLIQFRHTPFSAADFFVIKAALGVMNLYVSTGQLVLIVVASVAVICSLILIFLKGKKFLLNYRRLSMLLCLSIVFSLLPSGYITAEKDKKYKTNLTDQAYHYGFIFCFMNSIFNNGIKKPDKYSENNIYSIIENFQEESKEAITPNIIAIQLESFVDPYLFETSEYNKDPIPTFRKLKEEYTSGKLGVSVYGGGTANTEFEVLTGMSLKFFGIGEYPYESILRDRTVESVNYNLRDLGYTSHAIHNHTGTFYDRHLVYKNLGFDTFTPIEYMNNITYNALGWSKSNVLTKYIFDSLSSTPDEDFVFVATVQEHGKYPEKVNPKFRYKLKNGSDAVMNVKAELEYYINEINEEDEWLGDLIDELTDYDEPVMLILYGDHMPSFNAPTELLKEENIYSTEYVIWTNFDMPVEKKDLESYNLIPYALSKLNISNGIMTKVHQYGMKNEENYYDYLHKIQYDMIYGEKYVYEQSGTAPFEPTDMNMGVSEIKINNVKINSNKAKIIGENFTPSSVVYVDGNEVDTKFINEQTLQINASKCKNYNQITVCQQASNSVIFSETEPFVNE